MIVINSMQDLELIELLNPQHYLRLKASLEKMLLDPDRRTDLDGKRVYFSKGDDDSILGNIPELGFLKETNGIYRSPETFSPFWDTVEYVHDDKMYIVHHMEAGDKSNVYYVAVGDWIQADLLSDLAEFTDWQRR